MDFEGKYNIKSPAVKRLMREACELKEPTEEYWAHPLDDNLFEWHFTVQGPPATDFEGGVYHGRILLPAEYPMKPPNIILITPNGRFETNKKICLSISGHHPETWQPSWSIRTALLALIAFMPTPGNGTIGSLDYTPEERQMLARKSQMLECPSCGKVVEQLSSSVSKPPTQEESSLIRQIALKAEEQPVEEEGENEEEQQPSEDKPVRQRLGVSQHLQPQSQLQHATVGVVSSTSDSYKNWLMWFLVAVIIFLIYRRLFLV
ncbi:Ubiquitin-conjugating enzyme E2 J1 [Cryptotermes secundus]|uniref:Ubiquitin-conjugating enzyme E2 J1 n=1 Tax=Cryptotermes secundus TaxID=105785 RepID=A0A2J7QHP0_9NEOP|nr:ubiquitin-conjugating enzyme E2 J1 isoform X2 [Cryptotermes secundus]PNF28086.1 Ubiquitin-conjugating enzyme E2 J1 [Cryptotermes secundus]PNF28087.1 Ubiquitin-conjugating enzyme E2 J1 [Cryptotermes secundus]